MLTPNAKFWLTGTSLYALAAGGAIALGLLVAGPIGWYVLALVSVIYLWCWLKLECVPFPCVSPPPSSPTTDQTSSSRFEIPHTTKTFTSDAKITHSRSLSQRATRSGRSTSPRLPVATTQSEEPIYSVDAYNQSSYYRPPPYVPSAPLEKDTWPPVIEEKSKAQTELLSLINEAKRNTKDIDKQKALKAVYQAVKAKPNNDAEIKAAFKNLLLIVLQRRNDCFLFFPCHTTTSGNAVKDMLNAGKCDALRKVIEVPTSDNKLAIRYRDLRKYLTGETNNDLFHNRHYILADGYDGSYSPLVDDTAEVIAERRLLS